MPLTQRSLRKSGMERKLNYTLKTGICKSEKHYCYCKNSESTKKRYFCDMFNWNNDIYQKSPEKRQTVCKALSQGLALSNFGFQEKIISDISIKFNKTFYSFILSKLVSG